MRQKLVFKQIHITQPQDEFLRREAKETGLPMAEIIRAAIGEYMQRKLQEKTDA